MGNCIKKEASASWGGDDWSCLTTTPQSPFSGETGRGKKCNKNDNKKKTEETEPAGGGPRLVKIKLKRKELEELLGRAELQGMSAKEVVERLMGGCDGYSRSHETSRPWRPALQSIPEVN
ncbi:uncharacterized protein LOC127811186 [Diospyros lotus]|uniref:uncharacterized protein LOC127811186 n=1 Tax=Diospyros lotus TaxID=55363 RepID=UPI00224CBDCB|nr:uncharacterized protein LOC127811186 [Diospyros lotus]